MSIGSFSILLASKRLPFWYILVIQSNPVMQSNNPMLNCRAPAKKKKLTWPSLTLNFRVMRSHTRTSKLSTNRPTQTQNQRSCLLPSQHPPSELPMLNEWPYYFRTFSCGYKHTMVKSVLRQHCVYF